MTIKNNKITKISIILLLLLLFAVSFNYYRINSEFTNYTKNSELEIQVLESQLDEILTKYDSLGVESKNNKILIASLSKKQQEDFEKYQQLLTAKQMSQSQGANSKSAIASRFEGDFNKSNIIAVNIDTKGVKIFSDLYNKNNPKIQQLRVCYTLLSKSIVPIGARKIFIQVVNPKNQIISKGNLTIENETGTILKYSAVSEINFANQDIDTCAFVDLEDSKTIKGNYIINIYSDFTKIGTSIFEYN